MHEVELYVWFYYDSVAKKFTACIWHDPANPPSGEKLYRIKVAVPAELIPETLSVIDGPTLHA